MAGRPRVCRGVNHNVFRQSFNGDKVTDIWERVCKSLVLIIGADEVKNWIEKSNLAAVESGVAIIEVPTRFTGESVVQTYGEEILKALRQHLPDVARLDYRVRQMKNVDEARTDRIPQKSSAEDDLAGTFLIPRFTFSEFVVGKPNEVAYAAARAVSGGKNSAFSPLFFYGGVGLGKTHLMNAVGWELRKSDPSKKVMYLSAEQFTNLFVRSLMTKSSIEFKEQFRSVDVLMVDDVQFIAGKDSTQEEFFYTFNALAEQGKTIILSADRSPGKINGLEVRVRSRLQSGLAVELHPADYELRLGILQRKLEQHCKATPSVEIDEGLLEFIAHRVVSNSRVLEGALNRIVAAHFHLGRKITVDIALDVLADLLRETDRQVRIEQIIKCVAEYYKIKVADLTGRRRTQEVTRPRQIAIYLAKSLTSKSMPVIGREFNRDHTTVIHSIERVQKLLAQDSMLADDLELLRRRLEG